MELSFESDVERLQVAEEAVRIVKKFSSGKQGKKERSDRLVDLCTEIASIIDVNKRLERVVRQQESELENYRGEGAKSVAAASNSALGTTPAEDVQRLQTGLTSPSSGRGTSQTPFRDSGTDPLYAWPKRPSTQSRATSPLKSSSGVWTSHDSNDELTDTDEMDTRQEDYYTDDFVGESGTDEAQEKEDDDEATLQAKEDSSAQAKEHSSAQAKEDSSAQEHGDGPATEENRSEEDRDSEKRDEEDEEQEEQEHRDTKIGHAEMSEEERRYKEKKANPKTTAKTDNRNKNNKSKEHPKRRSELKKQGKDANDKTERKSQDKQKTGTKKQEKDKTNKSRKGEEVAADAQAVRKEQRKASSPKASRLQKKNETNKISRNVKPSELGAPSKSRKDSPEDSKDESKIENGKKSKDIKPPRKTRTRRSKDRSPARNRITKPTGREGSGKSVHWYSSDSSLSSDSEDDGDLRRKIRPELTTEYWEMHRLVKYLRVGNPTVTIIALCALQDFTLELEACQLSLIDLSAVPILLNLLNTDHCPCVIGSLKVLRRLSCSRRINTELYRLGGVQQLVQCLDNNSLDVQSLVAETLTKLVSFRRAYSAIRRHRGIKKLIDLLQPRKRSASSSNMRSYTSDQNSQTLCRNACTALWSCSKSAKNIQTIRNDGAVPILASLLANGPNDIILPTVGIIQECSNDAGFREDLRKEGLIEGIVRLLDSGDDDMKKLCASAIDKCAEDEETRELVLKHGGLEPMVEVLATKPCLNTDLLGAVAGAVWKCALHKDSMHRLERIGIISHLITQIKCDHPLMVMSNLIGALGEFAYSKRNILSIYADGVLNILIQKLNLTEANILINCTRLLHLCAKESACRSHILTSDGLRLMWSLLKSSNPKVVASAADGIGICAVNPQESAETVRSFVGGLELVTTLLKSNRREVLISICRLVINIGQDRENLSIMTDYDVIPILITLIYTPDDEEMRRYVAEAIATCCNLDKNIPALSSTVVPLADGLSTFKSVNVHRTTALALEKLSRDPHNCYLIHKHGALKHLMTMMGSSDEAVQNAAARCIKNVRISAINTHS